MNRLMDSLIKHEGLILRPYRCSAGKLTIGIGRNLDDNGISKDEALFLAENDIQDARTNTIIALPWFTRLDEVRQDVMTEMVFNLGIIKFLKFHRTIGYIMEGKFDEAADCMLDSKWAKQVGMKEGERAWTLSERMRTGKWEV